MLNPILWNLPKTHNTRWVEYVLLILLLSLGIRANAATYYWVGNSGSWHEMQHWSSSSGGQGNAFTTAPSITDDVVFDRNSFTISKQTVAISAAASCANLNFSDASHIFNNSNAVLVTFSSNITVSGNITIPADLKITNTGSIILTGAGSKVLSMPCTIAGSGSIQINDASGLWTLGTDLSYATGYLYLNKGGLNTNGKTVIIRKFSSTENSPRTLSLGKSKIQLRPVSSNDIEFWNIGSPQSLTFYSGTSTIEFYSASNNLKAIFDGEGLSYYNVVLNLPSSSPTSTTANLTIDGNNSFNKLTCTKGTLLLNGDNTFRSSLSLTAGHRYRFKIGTTQTLSDTASFVCVGTQASPIYLSTTSSSNYATILKGTGIVCSDQTYISMIKVAGGASWNSPSTNFNQSPSFTSGWNFGSSSALISTTITGGKKCKGEPFNLKLTFSGTTYPVTCILQNMWTLQYDTIEDIVNSTHYHSVNPLVTTSYRVAQVSSSGCYNSTVNISNVQAQVEVPLYGKLATWLGLKSSDWYDCNNWSNSAIPADTVDVTIVPNQLMTQPVIATGTASTQQIEIAYDADLTLFGSNTELNVFGDFINNGTFTPNDAKVSFIGNNVSEVSGGDYTTLVINNTTPEGITLQDTVNVTGTLTLNNGIVRTDGNLITISNPSPAAIANFGEDNYINGALERHIGDTGTYSFPVGDDVIYALCDITPRGGSGGVTSIKVQFINKPGTDDGLNLSANGLPINSVHPAGIWLIEPDQQPLFGGGVSGDYELTFHLDGFPNLENYEFFVLTRHDTSTSASDWTVAGNTMGSQIVDGKLVVSGITHFSQWGIGQGGGGSLPVKMTEFKAVPVDNKFIQLKWTTATEVDNSGFMVERSIDGEEYTNLGFVPGNGNTTETHSYTYNDKNVEAKKRYYYRLKQVDTDGDYEYSKVVTAQLNSDKTHRIGEFIPNPTSSVANLEINAIADERVTIEFKNPLGQVVKKGDLMLKKGNNNYRLDVNDLPAGNYLVVINTPEQAFTKKLVIKN